MHRTQFALLLVLLLSADPAIAQNGASFIVTGRVLDDSTSAPLQNVDVFLANTTLGSGTDRNGRFEIKDVRRGLYELVARRIGYRSRSVRVYLTDSAKSVIELRLTAQPLQLGEIVVSAPDPSGWKSQLERFTRQFLGTTQNAGECKIINAEVLDFEAQGRILSATARAPLEIENLALGYHIQFILNSYKIRDDQVLTFIGLPRYRNLAESTADEGSRWGENRRRAYNGSLRHFLASLFKRELTADGFTIYLIPDSEANLYHPLPGSEEDIPCDSAYTGEKTYEYKGVIRVRYEGESPEDGYNLPGAGMRTPQTSWLRFTYGAITINPGGLVQDWLYPIQISGYMAWERMADALPLDYVPNTR